MVTAPAAVPLVDADELATDGAAVVLDGAAVVLDGAPLGAVALLVLLVLLHAAAAKRVATTGTARIHPRT